MGFFDTLAHVMEGTGARKTSLMARIWKVYEALLQHCCKTDFVPIVQQYVDEKNEYKRQIEDEYEEHKKQYDQDNKSMLAKIKEAEKKAIELNETRIEAEKAQVQAERDVEEKKQQLEEEVKKRLALESKINQMYGVNMNLESLGPAEKQN